jgi:hypothetical protein
MDSKAAPPKGQRDFGEFCEKRPCLGCAIAMAYGKIRTAPFEKEIIMPAVPITSREQYIKAIGVLTDVGGTWHGVGDKERHLLVTLAQYEALQSAGLVPGKNGKETKGGKKKGARAKS